MRLSPRPLPLLLAAWAAPILAQQQNVTVTVLNAASQPPQPVRAVRVSLSYLDSGTVVTDAQQVTNGDGEALLLVSPGVVQRGDLRVEITGTENLVIWQPADGQLSSLGVRERIVLLPKGSPALLGPAQIQAMLHRTLLQVNSLQKQVHALQSQAAGSQKQGQQQNVDAALAEFARLNGFPPDQVRQQVQIWAQNIQLQSDQATAEQKALAEFALKNYAAAAQTFNQAADTAGSEIDATEAEAAALQKALLDKVRTQLQKLIDDRQQAASAYQLALQYHQATQTVESAAATAEAEYKKHPDDKGFQEIRLQAALHAADARSAEGEIAPASQSLPLLAQSAADLRKIADGYAAMGDPQDCALAEIALGMAMKGEGERAGADQSGSLLDGAVQAYRQALGVLTRPEHPADWAQAQMNIGVTLREEAVRASGDRSVDLLDQSAAALRSALDVYTRPAFPHEWAAAELNLGTTLLVEGEHTEGDRALVALAQAAAAYRSALDVVTRTEFPQMWARAQNNLAIVLSDEGTRVAGSQSISLLDQSAQAYRNALQILTRSSVPQDWANIQSNLALTLSDEASQTTGDKSAAFSDQAIEAYQNALDVYTKSDLPQDWARTQDGLGGVLAFKGERDDREPQALDAMNQAIQDYQNAVEVFTRQAFPQDWARTQINLGRVWVAEGERERDSAAAAHFDRAAHAFRNALQVYTETDLPQDWARAQADLGLALMNEADQAGDDKAPLLLSQAAQAYRASLRVFQKNSLPQSWAASQNDLGVVLEEEGTRASGNASIALLNQAIQAYQDALEVRTRASFPYDWIETQLNLTETDLEAARYADCVHNSELLSSDPISPAEAIIRDTIAIACQWGLQDRAAAAQLGSSLSARSSLLHSSPWDFSGTVHILSASPAFASGRASWIALFTAVQNGDGPAMTAALHQLEPLLRQ